MQAVFFKKFLSHFLCVRICAGTQSWSPRGCDRNPRDTSCTSPAYFGSAWGNGREAWPNT